MERLKSSFRKFYGRYGDLIQQYEVSLSRMLNDIMTLDQQWQPNQSDFPPISWPWYRLWPSPNYEWFPWSICNGCGMPAAGNAYPSGHLVPSPILGLAYAPIRKIRTTVVSMHTRAFAHLPIVLHCYDVIIFLARKVAQIENNGFGRWLNANPYGQSVIRIFRIVETKFLELHRTNDHL